MALGLSMRRTYLLTHWWNTRLNINTFSTYTMIFGRKCFSSSWIYYLIPLLLLLFKWHFWGSIQLIRGLGGMGMWTSDLWDGNTYFLRIVIIFLYQSTKYIGEYSIINLVEKPCLTPPSLPHHHPLIISESQKPQFSILGKDLYSPEGIITIC